jgi:hypothetical protein
MTIACTTPTLFEIEFDARNMNFKDSYACFLGDDEDYSTESTFYGEDCTSVAFDDDYFDDDSSASTCSSNSNSTSCSSSSCSSDSCDLTAPSGRAVTSRFGDEDSIVLARARSQPQASTEHEQDQEDIAAFLLEGLTIEFELQLKPLQGENDIFYPAAAAA